MTVDGTTSVEETVDVALADQALATGARRHTPVASNHYPGAHHGSLQLHNYPNGDECWSVAVLFPAEVEDDPTAGLWWVLVEEVAAAIGTYYALVSATGEERSDFASIEEATRWLAGRIGLAPIDLILVDRSSSASSELAYEVRRTEDSEWVGTVGEGP